MSSKHGKQNERPALPGTNRVRKVLADGTVKFYDYIRKGAVRTCIAAPRDTLDGLMHRFEASTDFSQLADQTKKEYRRRFAVVAKEWGSTPLRVLQDNAFVDQVLEWRDKIAKRTPREADSLLMVISSVLSWAVGRRILDNNVLIGVRRAYTVDRSKVRWTDADIAAFAAVASRELQFALLLAICTAQRQGDLLSLRWSQYDGARLRLTQRKTGADVVVPCRRELRALLDSMPRVAETILTTCNGKPWTTNNFRHLWGKAMIASGIKYRVVEGKKYRLHFHDLRGTAITAMGDAGATLPQIMAISGHSLGSAAMVGKYLAKTAQQAEDAIRLLEAHTTMPALELLAPVTIDNEEEDHATAP